ncbi:MAG: DUF1559 domain-containing protein [Planctomycetaceae bacterium]
MCPCRQGRIEELKAEQKRGSTWAKDDSPLDSRLARFAIEVTACLLLSGLVVALLMPPRNREAVNRTQCKNNLKQIALAMHNYHDVYGTFPPAVTYSADGKPMHSWRVLLLPFLGEAGLHGQYNMNEPWDSPANSQLLSQMPKVYACPSAPQSMGETHYAVPVGAKTMFPPERGVSIREITDGTSNTIMVVETQGTKLNWMAPVDLTVSAGVPGAQPPVFSSLHMGGFHVSLADGAVRFLSSNMTSQMLESLLTRNGAEAVNPF